MLPNGLKHTVPVSAQGCRLALLELLQGTTWVPWGKLLSLYLDLEGFCEIAEPVPVISTRIALTVLTLHIYDFAIYMAAVNWSYVHRNFGVPLCI